MEINNQIIGIFDDLAQRFGVVLDWTNNNVVPYVQELLNKFLWYKMIVHCFSTIVAILVIFYVLKFFDKIAQEKRNLHKIANSLYYDQWGDFTDSTLLWVIASTVLLIASAITIAYEINCIIQLCVIPELYLVEYIKNIM